MHLCKKLLVVVGASLLLSACDTYVSRDEVMQLHNGMTPRSVAQVVSSEPVETIEMRIHRHHIMVQIYGAGRGTYLLAYKDHRLFHRGTLNNFLNSPNRLVRIVGRRTQADRDNAEY